MAPSIVHLPNGQTLTVNPSFGGLYFKANDLNPHHNVFPPGWTIILHSEDDFEDDDIVPSAAAHTIAGPHLYEDENGFKPAPPKPTLKNDHLFISSISNPSSSDFKAPSSPTRQIAMMLWATLWWYFHQPAPEPQQLTPASASTPDAGKPKGEWKIYINREGIFKGRQLLPKLERMGLITTEDSSVGVDPEDGSVASQTQDGWKRCFVSSRSFWQLDPRIYLFTIAPTHQNSPYPAMSPATSRPSSRPGSPTRALSSNAASGGGGLHMTSRGTYDHDKNSAEHTHSTLTAASNIIGGGGGGHFGHAGAGGPTTNPANASSGLWRGPSTPPNPFSSGSHLPTFYPPHPLQYTFTNSIRHPIRSKPPRQGETFYTRYIPSLNQYLSFRVASLSNHPITHRGPTARPSQTSPSSNSATHNDPISLSIKKLSVEKDTTDMTDVDLLHKWMNDDRISHSWGEQGPKQHQAEFLRNNLQSRHSFPAIGLFDGKPFGYFEIYWVKEDRLSMHLGGQTADWDRGLHCLVGEQEFRGPQRVKVWLSALLHYCWLADLRTEAVVMEPRVDNERLRKYCEEVGFYKQQEITFSHKQSNLMKIRREAWERPAL